MKQFDTPSEDFLLEKQPKIASLADTNCKRDLRENVKLVVDNFNSKFKLFQISSTNQSSMSSATNSDDNNNESTPPLVSFNGLVPNYINESYLYNKSNTSFSSQDTINLNRINEQTATEQDDNKRS